MITFSLADEPTSECGTSTRRAGFWNYVEQVREALDARGRRQRRRSAASSYGGSIAAAFAARHPGQVSSLILVSARAGPRGGRTRATSFYAASPVAADAALLPRLGPASIGKSRLPATPGGAAGSRAACASESTCFATCFIPAAWLGVCICSPPASRDGSRPTSARVQVPVLMVTGEDALERVVPPRR